MIGQMQRWRQWRASRFNTWRPDSDIAVFSLRAMPGELQRDGQPTDAFWQHIVALAATGWLAGGGQPALPRASPAATLISSAGRAPFRPFAKLVVVTELAMHDALGARLTHLVCAGSGVVLASATSQLTLADPARPQPVTTTLVRPSDSAAAPVKSVSLPTR